MKVMKNLNQNNVNMFKQVSTIEDVENFFKWLNDNDLLVHPDDGFEDLVGNEITSDEAKELDEILNKCFDICGATGDDNLIYSTALKVACPEQFESVYYNGTDLTSFESIKSLDDIEKFFNWLAENELFSHPDDSFDEVCPQLEEKVQNELNYIMHNCRFYCINKGDENLLYKVGVKVQSKFLSALFEK